MQEVEIGRLFFMVLFKASYNLLRFHMGRKKHVIERHTIKILNQNIVHGLVLGQTVLDCKGKLGSGESKEGMCLAIACSFS